MSISSRVTILIALLAMLPLAGCRPKKKPVNFDAQLPEGSLALRKIPPSEYPDFSRSTWNLDVLPRSIDASIEYMNHPSSRQFYPYLDISHERAQASNRAFREVIANAQQRGSEGGNFIDSEIRAKFEVYKSWGAPKTDGAGFTDRVLFTGYFTPIYEASMTKSGLFQFPLYKRPPDLATDPATGETIGRKNPDGSITPYWTRKEIEGDNKLAGLEFVYLKSRWEAYIITIQGSAQLKLQNGKMLEIGYAGHNGHEYSSPGQQMIADGVITESQWNLRGLADYFNANPAAMDKYLWLNKRTVFFTERPGGPFGSLNVPVTTFATIATDKNKRPNIYPRSMPAFLNVHMAHAQSPQNVWKFEGFMMDQDSGGAIRASGRADIYMGIGPEAETLAGHQRHEGELYYIAVKPELIPQYSQPGPNEKIPVTGN